MKRLLHGFHLRAITLGVAIALSSSTLSTSALAQPAEYPSAEAATDAFVAALRANDKAALDKVLGKDWRDYIPVDGVDREDVDAFLAKYDAKHAISSDEGVSHLVVGENWTLPLPLARQASGWSFDLVRARDEIRVRQIGNNELATLQAMLAYCDAQREYASEDRNGDDVLEYAQRVLSTQGKRDGLYWETREGEALSPLGPAFAGKDFGKSYYGYRYRILTAQGPSAPGGAYDYMIGGRMRSGFAVIAWPETYGVTGVMSFMTSHDGLEFQKDLGKDTPAVAKAIRNFDPDSSWQEVSESE